MQENIIQPAYEENQSLVFGTSLYENQQNEVSFSKDTVTDEYQDASTTEANQVVLINQSAANTMNISSEIMSSNEVFSTASPSNVPETRFKKRVLKNKRKCRPKLSTRKNVVNKKRWIDNEAKEARRSGTAGVGREGKTILSKEKKPGCGDSCRSKCRNRVSEDDRDFAKNEFYDLKDPTKFWICL